MVFLRVLFSDADSIVEHGLIIDDVICRKHQHKGVVAILRRLQGRKGNRWCRIAADWLKNDIPR